MKPIDVGFSINWYNRDGEIVDEGVYLHIGETIRLPFADLAALKHFSEQVQTCINEIDSRFPSEGILKR